MDMKTLLTYLKLIYPRPHEHSSYAIIAVALSLVFVSPENMRTLTDKLDSYHMMKWWSISAVLLQFFYFFISPFVRKLSYSNFVRWYVTWILAAALYHLPSFQSVGVDTRMNSSLFSTMFVSSLFVLIHLHLLYHGLRYGLKDTGLVSGVAVRRSMISHVIQHCTLLWAFGISWSAPVGSDHDDPLPSKPAIYGESSDEISPIYSLWGLYIFLYITNFFVDILTRWALKQVQLVEESEDNHPKFLDMVPWYSGTSADLFKTLFDLLVSVTVFLGRFDMRMMQATMNDSRDGANQEDFLYDHFSEKKEFWFDFMADTGDGGNSSYSIARLLAQRSLHARKNDSLIELPRGDLLLIGGDLAYPNPSTDTYEERFFYPFEEALPPPSWYNKKHLAVNKPELPVGVFDIRQYSGPQSFVIPGNHDWIDGLQTFMRYICQKSWLGGWLMPQKKSYFALQLPKGWWVFGLDVALHNDIDSFQFKFFSELIRNRVKENDFVIVMTHAPNWILDSYWNDETGKNVSHLISDHLMGKCKLRIAGDLHHYMRHSSRKPATVQHLLVNGGGGAFLHPTHVFSNHIEAYGTTYETEATYPSVQDSIRLAKDNIDKFRIENRQFDFVGGIIYFILTFSMFPLCDLDHILQDDTISGHMKNLFGAVWDAFMYMVGQSYVSFVGALILLVAAILFVPSKVSKKKRVIIGVLHVSAHIVLALVLMLLMELCIQICIRNNLLATSDYHSLYEWYRIVESEQFPDSAGLRARIEQWTFGLYPACIKYLMSAFDVPEVMAVTRTNICKNGMVSLSRGSATIYYVSVFLYFWVLSTPVVSIVFGSYLYICVNWLHLHFDEAFSSLRIADYKSFTRFHIKEDGSLEVFTLAVDKVPKEWKRRSDSDNKSESHSDSINESKRKMDSNLDNESNQQEHMRQDPSKWEANPFHQDPTKTVRIVDHFVIKRETCSESSNESELKPHSESENKSELKLHSDSDNDSELKPHSDTNDKSEWKMDSDSNDESLETMSK
ncbi:putative calcineurin-like phosphoesterase domain, ApaH type, metallo-dependent phosphatase [Helianthus annuus]|uniref:Calcineurin-like phosphoesterase domain, ApaH type, metallo-dependent phosphatase n=1 Tax=Helianthus annuus TaxID=4232 RepID=A0A251TZX6_HELAN|nr:uncharacterized protein LOC110879457 [Helianthus annuus]KAF5792364.1 putative calcineurin-like phosphoesterase domain, ApaH type, metallo-dependent phosphatase [Helianthus annuus]KAJ0527312.1 putative calcineurin-like phosphoesterase domain, ApaH type, metallo-dependent phosphatase [Helianthus annuus]KAJ0543714.1 putative calcineurin-like phosphoesterase domain, ApaH type, metallo-dependent phosphatase [Helianthus annuus]KAJ0708769.1 putative calcineurin-like phosphoesterase domain, ApaH typ